LPNGNKINASVDGRKRSSSTTNPEEIKFNNIMGGNSEPDAMASLFTDRNVTLAKYLLSGERREIRNKYQYEKHSYSVIIHCTTYYPMQFHALRELVAGPNGDERFIESLSRCKNWNAKGGKSGSTWAKTLDDRFVLKQISRIELESFLEFAPLYFEYICKSFFHKVPTALAKIFGIYSVRWKNSTGKSMKKDLIVMENLFYNKKISQIYDLKGSLRGRFVQNPIQDEVLLDENLLQITYASPICIPEHSKTLLGQAVWNDTAFLSSLNVMDYSLLVGIDSETNELVVGIIDYMRRFTWDKQLEAWVKSSGIMGGRGKVPTVISPKQYKVRFRDAMWMYFVMVPNKFTKILNPHPTVLAKKKDFPSRKQAVSLQ
jgi:1-phosphatidylinositol-3-phosphate 5-kinase